MTKARRLSGDHTTSRSAPGVLVMRCAGPPSLAGAAKTSPCPITATFCPSPDTAKRLKLCNCSWRRGVALAAPRSVIGTALVWLVAGS
jgi:hypothetical protein